MLCVPLSPAPALPLAAALIVPPSLGEPVGRDEALALAQPEADPTPAERVTEELPLSFRGVALVVAVGHALLQPLKLPPNPEGDAEPVPQLVLLRLEEGVLEPPPPPLLPLAAADVVLHTEQLSDALSVAEMEGEGLAVPMALREPLKKEVPVPQAEVKPEAVRDAAADEVADTDPDADKRLLALPVTLLERTAVPVSKDVTVLANLREGVPLEEAPPTVPVCVELASAVSLRACVAVLRGVYEDEVQGENEPNAPDADALVTTVPL